MLCKNNMCYYVHHSGWWTKYNNSAATDRFSNNKHTAEIECTAPWYCCAKIPYYVYQWILLRFHQYQCHSQFFINFFTYAWSSFVCVGKKESVQDLYSLWIWPSEFPCCLKAVVSIWYHCFAKHSYHRNMPTMIELLCLYCFSVFIVSLFTTLLHVKVQM